MALQPFLLSFALSGLCGSSKGALFNSKVCKKLATIFIVSPPLEYFFIALKERHLIVQGVSPKHIRYIIFETFSITVSHSTHSQHNLLHVL